MLNRLFLCKCSVVVLQQRENVSQTAAAESHWEDIIRLCREHLGSFIIITSACCSFILMHVWNFLVNVVVAVLLCYSACFQPPGGDDDDSRMVQILSNYFLVAAFF